MPLNGLIMKYSVFVKASHRNDKSSNDKTHFFSSLISNNVAYLLFLIGFTPNLATFLFLVLGIGSGLCLINDNLIASYILWRLHIIVDMADGIIARATSSYSKSAMGFDRSNHIVINLLFLLGASSEINYIVQYFFVCFFLLSYLFSRNYFITKQETLNFSYKKIILKNIIGLEGFVFLSTIGSLFFNFSNYPAFFISYGIFFAVIFFYKLYLFRRMV